MNAPVQEIEGASTAPDSPERVSERAKAPGKDRQWAEAVLAAEKRVLEMIAGGNTLSTILDSLCREVEEMSCGSLCSILLLDAKGERRWPGAAPNLPKSYT